MTQAIGKRESSLRTTKNFLGLLYITACTFAALYAPQPLLSSIHTDYSILTTSTITLIMTLALFPLGIGPLVYGSFLSSLSTRKVLLYCVGFLGLAEFGLFFSTSFSVVLSFRLLQGLLIPAILTCLMAHIGAKYQGEALQRAMSVYIGITILGGLMGRVMSGLVASLWGWRFAFLLWGAALLVGIIFISGLEKEAKAHFCRVRMREFWDILRTPGIASLLIIDCCGFFVFAALSNALPFRLQEIGAGLSDWHISLMYLGAGLGVIIAFSSRAIQKFFGGEIKSILAGVALYCATLPGFLSESVWILFLAMCLVCAGQFTEHSTSPGLINRLALHDKGAVNGLYLSSYYVGGALGSYIPVLIYGAYGWGVFIACLTGVMVLTIGFTLYLGRTLSPERLREEAGG